MIAYQFRTDTFLESGGDVSPFAPCMLCHQRRTFVKCSACKWELFLCSCRHRARMLNTMIASAGLCPTCVARG